jgi:hypothetical protein
MHTNYLSVKNKLTSEKIQLATIATFNKSRGASSSYTNSELIICRNRRQRGIHPSTPDKHQVMSKRTWDGRIRAWRALLHSFDPEPAACVLNTQSLEAEKDCTPENADPTPAPTAPEARKLQASLFDDFTEDGHEDHEVDEDDLL